MCLATVYVDSDGQRKPVMDDVAWIRPQSHGLQLITFLGESRLLQAEIQSIDLVHGRIIVRQRAGDEPAG